MLLLLFVLLLAPWGRGHEVLEYETGLGRQLMTKSRNTVPVFMFLLKVISNYYFVNQF